jgi:hypothetical protein
MRDCARRRVVDEHERRADRELNELCLAVTGRVPDPRDSRVFRLSPTWLCG